MAVDGSRMEVPNSKECQEAYGKSINQYGEAVARANFSGMYDVLNRFFVDIGIHRFRSGEIEEAKEHFERMRGITGKKPVAVIFDRNYVSLEFMHFLEKSGVKYLIRVKDRTYQKERDGMEGDDEEVDIAHTASRLAIHWKNNPEAAKELNEAGFTHARIIKARFGKEENGALITNLPAEIGSQEIIDLYRERWWIEKKYHTLKNKLKIESVAGKAAIYVKQDFWASVMVYNMLQDILRETDKNVREKSREKGYKHEVRTNENLAIGIFKDHLIRLLLYEDPEERRQQMEQLQTDMERHIVPVRSQPSRARKWNYLNKNKCNQKPSF